MWFSHTLIEPLYDEISLDTILAPYLKKVRLSLDKNTVNKYNSATAAENFQFWKLDYVERNWRELLLLILDY